MSKANKHCINVVIMILYELSADSRQFWYIIAIAQLWVLREGKLTDVEDGFLEVYNPLIVVGACSPPFFARSFPVVRPT
jgi:hypothetical protein